MFASRWLLAPFYIGLVGAIAILLVKFVKEFVALLPQVLTLEGGQVMVGVLTPEWMGHVTFSDLKIKLIGSIVAISGIELLKAFVNIDSHSNQQIAWKIALHMTFVLSGVLFAVMDRLTAGKSGGH